MMLIPCPQCGLRAETEFRCGGEASATPDGLRTNAEGWLHETWRHVAGCGRWFHAWRHTRTLHFAATWRIGDTPPPHPGPASSDATRDPPQTRLGGDA